MKIVVTGGAGFIGSNVVDTYVDAGHEVIVIDDLSTGKQENLNSGAKFYKVDIRSEEIRNIFESERPDVVNHHAAQMSVPASVVDPIFDADVNVRGLLNILEAARESGAGKVIFISSGGAVYGDATQYPTSEEYIPQPLSPYAITKYVAEKYLAFYNHQYGLDYTVLRYGNVYGPRQVPHGEAGVVAIFMDRLLDGKACRLYHFEDEPKGMTRDYCYVGDVARSNLLALDSGSGDFFNIGTSVATHTLDLFNAIFDSLKVRIQELPVALKEPERGKARPGDIKRSCLNVEKAGEKLGWRPEISLVKGIEKTLDWKIGES